MIEQYIQRVQTAIDKASVFSTIDNKSRLEEKQFAISGMSTPENRVLLNEILQSGDKYLEIGVHRGSTFISALYKHEDVRGIAIDNFSQFGGIEIKGSFLENCEASGIKNMTFIESDCFNLTDANKEIIRGTNVYFYDGDHKAIDQEMALSYYMDLLTNPFIFIVDDYNHLPAIEGTQNGIKNNNLVVHKEWILNHNNSDRTWHNGLYLAVISR